MRKPPTRIERFEELMESVVLDNTYRCVDGTHEIRYGVAQVAAVLAKLNEEYGPDIVPQDPVRMLGHLQREYNRGLPKNSGIKARLELPSSPERRKTE